MCEKCDHLTLKLKQSERLRASGFDKLTIDLIETLMADLRAERAGLHLQETGRSR
jgi:hypothetical protein